MSIEKITEKILSEAQGYADVLALLVSFLMLNAIAL